MAEKEEFERLFGRWLKESESRTYSYDSDSYRICNLDSYRQIVSLGQGALPFIVEKLQDGYFTLNSAMEQITGIPLSNIKEGKSLVLSEQEISRLWIKWWKKHSSQKISFHVQTTKHNSN